jgi:pyruvate,water dikinase
MQPSLLHRVLPYRWLLFRPALKNARRTLPLRENPKHHFLLYATEIRRTILELARRLVAKGLLSREEDVFFLTREELAAAADSAERGAAAPGLPEIVSARRALYERYRAWTPPEAIPMREVAEIERAVQQGELPGAAEQQAVAPSAMGALHGIAASSGVVTARARVALTPDDGAEIEPGEVLVAPFTDPGWTPLFTVAGAVVMDLGGLLSHGAIVAREYGIPAVVNTRSATTMLRTGQLITVDGNTGTVTWGET